MVQLEAFLLSVPTFSWLLIAFGVAVPFAVGYYPHAKRAYHQGRLDRRLARDAYILREEMQDYEYHIGEELDELAHGKMFREGLLNGIFAAGTYWLTMVEWDYIYLVFFGSALLGWAYTYWRKVNDPDDLPPDREDYIEHQRPEYPPEAIAGFTGAILMVIVVVGFIMSI